LPAGDYTLRVTLNTNEHSVYAVDDEVISDEVKISVE